jgi:predicted glycosyltransferase
LDDLAAGTQRNGSFARRLMMNESLSILLYCEIYRGLGHWVRTATLAATFAKRFRTVLVCTGNLREDIAPPEGVELIRFPRGAHFPCMSDSKVWGGRLIELLERVSPAAVIIEYYPFGRQQSSLYAIPFLRAAKTLQPPALVFSSVRDIHEQALEEQLKFDRRVVQGVNRLIDAVLVHSDPRIVELRDTFALVPQLEKPIFHTGYVAQPLRPATSAPDAEPVCLISVGGGGGGEAVLRVAVEAAVKQLYPEDMTVRIAAGSLIPDELWEELQSMAAGVPRLELRRWIPNLRGEMARADVSVSRCGYNTALDLIATGVRSLVIPFVETEEDEQTFRAYKLRDLGVLRMLEQSRLTPETLAEEVAATRAFQPRRLEVDMDGAANTVAIVERLIEERRAAHHPAAWSSSRMPELPDLQEGEAQFTAMEFFHSVPETVSSE